MNITISGLPGSGTTTAAKLLAKKLNYKHIYAGAIFRDMAKESGKTLAEYNKIAETDTSIDTKLEQKMLSLAKNRDSQILEGRLTGWVTKRNKLDIPRVWIGAPFETRLQRIAGRDHSSNREEARPNVIEREKSERKRYKAIYNIDINDLSIYDVIVDSSQMSPDKIVDFIIDKLNIQS